jgi:hypothetical protein
MSAPAEASREVPRETTAEAPRDVPAATETPSARAASAPTDVAAPSVAARDDIVPGAVLPAAAESGGAGAMAPPTVRERVTSWAKGEVQEFRDGVKREINEFHSRYEKIRGFFKR